MTLARLHVVTDDGLLARPEFPARAAALMHAHGAGLALHIRGRGPAACLLYQLAAELAPVALRTGAQLCCNDRVDVALAVRAGAHLHAGSIPVTAARRLLHHAPLGYSAHSVAEAAAAAAEGADYVFLGTIYASASHPGRPAAGPALVGAASGALAIPVIAIGGVTPARVPELLALGAYGVAVIRGVWEVPDPVAAAAEYLEALTVKHGQADEH